ncbi:hypothetical protein HanRHA438_Chr12g0567001 [Helianthus annuus]|nr:hypothetical protein HanRHA438_Chr12g0567001 [Helianthus annuus]
MIVRDSETVTVDYEDYMMADPFWMDDEVSNGGRRTSGTGDGWRIWRSDDEDDW